MLPTAAQSTVPGAPTISGLGRAQRAHRWGPDPLGMTRRIRPISFPKRHIAVPAALFRHIQNIIGQDNLSAAPAPLRKTVNAFRMDSLKRGLSHW